MKLLIAITLIELLLVFLKLIIDIVAGEPPWEVESDVIMIGMALIALMRIGVLA